jgi:hypothetical protein
MAPSREGGFQAWVVSGNYRPNTVGLPATTVFDEVAIAEFVPYANYDFERFSLAAKESSLVTLLEYSRYNLAGWPLLKLYYSSFFGAHAIMRSQGSGLVKLDRQHSQHLTKLLRAYDPSSGEVFPGMFYYVTKQSGLRAGQLSLVIEPVSSGSGVHESFWRLFCRFLQDEAEKASKKNAADSNLFVAGAVELAEVILNGPHGGGAWLSSMRNEINYQHKHDCWFPLRKKSASLGALDGAIYADSSTIRLDGSKEKEAVWVFTNITKYIVNLSIEVANFVARRSTVGGAFGQKWRRLQEIIG